MRMLPVHAVHSRWETFCNPPGGGNPIYSPRCPSPTGVMARQTNQRNYEKRVIHFRWLSSPYYHQSSPTFSTQSYYRDISLFESM